MDPNTGTVRRAWAIAALVFLVAAIPLGIVWTAGVRQKVQEREARAATLAPDSPEARQAGAELAQLRRSLGVDWTSIGAAVVGTGLLAFAMRRGPASPWLATAAVAPVSFLVLSTTSMAVTLDPLPVLRLVVALAALVPYVGIALPLGRRLQYGVCCGCLGMLALFFGLWEPPLPKPVPIKRHLGDMAATLSKVFPGWTSRQEKLPKEVEAVLGADEYLNLELTSPEKDWAVQIFITYNANAMSKVPHVPWVCMTQSGFRLVSKREEDVLVGAAPGREIKINVMLFDPGEGMGSQQALMFQYFNVGGVYTYNREWTRVLATSGSIGQKGSYLSQTQVAVKFLPTGREDPTAKASRAYQTGMLLLNAVVPLLEQEYYPDLRGAGGG